MAVQELIPMQIFFALIGKFTTHQKFEVNQEARFLSYMNLPKFHLGDNALQYNTTGFAEGYKQAQYE